MNKNEQLSRLTASRELCEQLVAAGIIPWATLWHLKSHMDEGENVAIVWEIDSLEGTDGSGEYSEDEAVPAWTKEELDVMLGPSVNLPQLPEPRFMGRLGNARFHTWFGSSSRIDCEKGADCSARVLLYALKENGIKVEDANRRFLDVFQLVENGLIDLAKHPPIKL